MMKQRRIRTSVITGVIASVAVLLILSVGVTARHEDLFSTLKTFFKDAATDGKDNTLLIDANDDQSPDFVVAVNGRIVDIINPEYNDFKDNAVQPNVDGTGKVISINYLGNVKWVSPPGAPPSAAVPAPTGSSPSPPAADPFTGNKIPLPASSGSQPQGTSGKLPLIDTLKKMYGDDAVAQHPDNKGYYQVDINGDKKPDIVIDGSGTVIASATAVIPPKSTVNSNGDTTAIMNGDAIIAFDKKDPAPPIQFDPSLGVTKVTTKDGKTVVTANIAGKEEIFDTFDLEKDGKVSSLSNKDVSVNLVGPNMMTVMEGKKVTLYYGGRSVGSGDGFDGKNLMKDGKVIASFDGTAFYLYDGNGKETKKVFLSGNLAGGVVDIEKDTKEGYHIIKRGGQRIGYCTDPQCTNPIPIQYKKNGDPDCLKMGLGVDDCKKLTDGIASSYSLMESYRALARGAAAGQGYCSMLKLFKIDCGDGMFKQYDEFMQQTVLGNFLSGDTSKLCQIWGKTTDTNDITLTPSGAAAAWAAAEVTTLTDPTSNATVSYLYKITFDVATGGIVESGCKNKLVPFTIELDNDVIDINLNNDTSDDTIKVKCDGGGYKAVGSRTLVRYYSKKYSKICIHFLESGQLNSFFKSQLDNGRFCNRIASGGSEYKGSRCTWCIFGSGTKPDTQNPEPNVDENRPSVVNP